MSLSITDFRSQLPGQGSRPALFYVQITNPIDSSADAKIQFLCKAAELPPTNVQTTLVGYKGRQIKIAGEKSYGSWTVTVINDEDFAIRNAMEAWMNSINGNISNVMSDYGYTSVALVTQQDKQGNDVRTYRMSAIWPSNISAMARSFDTTNIIDEFQVTFNLDFFTAEGITGSGGND